MPYNSATPLTTLSILLTQPVVATCCMVPTLSNQSANPVVPTLPVLQANVPLLGGSCDDLCSAGEQLRDAADDTDAAGGASE